MNGDDRIVAALSRIPDVAQGTALFVRMTDGLATINVGTETISIPAVGFYPPVAGMVVQWERRNGQMIVTGPAQQLNPIGKIKAAGTPRAEVTVDGIDYSLIVRDGAVFTVGDDVEINWHTGVVQAKLATTPTVSTPPTASGPGDEAFSNLFARAVSSGHFDSRWWGDSDVWATNSNRGAWFYGNRGKDALAGATLANAQIFLPLEVQRGQAFIGTHPHPSRPGGMPDITNLTPLTSRSGWVDLPSSFFGPLIAGHGIGVTSGSGYNIWSGVSADTESGKLRFSGTR